MFTLTLPYPPSINHAFSVIRGRPVLSQQTRAFRQRVRGLVRSARIPTLLGPLAVRLELYPPDDRRRDCDNAQKSLLDALTQAGAFVDDSQIVWLLTIKTPASAAGKAIVIASSLPGDPFPSCGLEPTEASLQS
jgi:crossover junction endodeoxyribonuclease RusA